MTRPPVELDGDEPPLPLEAEELLSWLAVERGRSPRTLDAYRRDLRRYHHWLHARGRALDVVSADDVAAYVADLRRGGLAPATVARAMVVVRSLHRFLVEEGTTEVDPTADLAPPRVPSGLPRALSEEEVTRLLGAVAGADPLARRDRVVLEVLYGAGLRISELVGLSLGDLDREAGLVRVLGKGGRERVVPLGGSAGRAVDEWLAEGGRAALVPERWTHRDHAEALVLNARGGRLTRQGAWGVVRRHAARVGLGDRMTPHVLRHSCATHMLERGADIRVVQELLGHASISTTQVYTRVSPERLRAVFEAAHPRAH